MHVKAMGNTLGKCIEMQVLSCIHFYYSAAIQINTLRHACLCVSSVSGGKHKDVNLVLWFQCPWDKIGHKLEYKDFDPLK